MVLAMVSIPSRWIAETSSVFIDLEGSVTLIPALLISLIPAMATAMDDSSPLPSIFDIADQSALDTCPTGLPSLPNIESILCLAACSAEEISSAPPNEALDAHVAA